MPQTSITKHPPKAVRGMLGDTRPQEILGRVTEGRVDFGYLVTWGTDPATQVKAVSAAADISDNPAGFIVNALETELDYYPDKRAANVLRKGTLWVQCVSAAVAQTPVLAANADGAIHGTAAAGRTAVPGCKFMTSAGAGEFALIEIDLVGQ